MRARTMSSLSATRTLLRGISGYLQLRAFPGTCLRSWRTGRPRLFISNNFCLLDHGAAVVVLERVAAVRTEELVFFELRANELARAESARDLKELFAHLTRKSECPRIQQRCGASTTSVDGPCRVECGSNSVPRPVRGRSHPVRWSTRGFRAD